MSYFLRGLPQNPHPLRLFYTKSVNVHKPSATTGRTNADNGFPSRVYNFFGPSPELLYCVFYLYVKFPEHSSHMNYVLFPCQKYV